MKRLLRFGLMVSMVVLYHSACQKKREKNSIQPLSGHENMVMLTRQEESAAGINLDTAQLQNISSEVLLYGKVLTDEEEVVVIPSHSKGRIEKLHVRNESEWVKTGQPLYDLYSEELLAEISDYIFAVKESRRPNQNTIAAKELADAARKKLILRTLSEEQISQLPETAKNLQHITFSSPSEGYVVSLSIREGEYVEAGTSLFTISSVKNIRVEAQVYPEDNLNAVINTAEIEFPALKGTTVTGSRITESASVTNERKYSTISFRVVNNGNLLKPGMMAYVRVKNKISSGVVIPKSSLLIHGKDQLTVWVKTAPGMYEPRTVMTGTENGDEIEIISGVGNGELVVSRGAYLLQSEYLLKRGSSGTHSH